MLSYVLCNGIALMYKAGPGVGDNLRTNIPSFTFYKVLSETILYDY